MTEPTVKPADTEPEDDKGAELPDVKEGPVVDEKEDE